MHETPLHPTINTAVEARPEAIRRGTRPAVLLYGVACYAVFFGTFLYAFAFVANLATPGLDGAGTTGGVGTLKAAAVDLFLLLVFAVQHSVMARPWFKMRLTRIIPEPAERSTYVLLSSATLLLLCVFWRPVGGVVWESQGYARVALTVAMAAGWLLVLATTFMINHFDLFGLRQAWLFFRGRVYSHLPFKTPSLYARVRHPLYVGWFIGFWAAPTMSGAHLLFAVATTAYILLAIRWEERDLLAAHGERYADYRRRVPMLMPRLRASTQEGS